MNRVTPYIVFGSKQTIDRSYLWTLARTPEIDDSLRDELILKAAEAGIDIEPRIFVGHDRDDPAR